MCSPFLVPPSTRPDFHDPAFRIACSSPETEGCGTEPCVCFQGRPCADQAAVLTPAPGGGYVSIPTVSSSAVRA